jgi:co-chaperonin GroES (HSP10)
LERYTSLASLIGTEKAKSEFLIAPILAEVRDQVGNQIGLFSGTEFSVEPEKGLQGFCDFILSRSAEQLDVTAPVMTIVEAKNDNLKSGLGQCIAEMVAAQIFNDREGKPIEVIYGAVTSGTNWRFLRLQGQTIEIDEAEYFINQIDQILGILLLPFQALLSQD